MKVMVVNTGLALLLAGCASTQAPLIYVSKQTLGVEIGGGAQDAGSASLVLGFRNTDAAIVPTTASNIDGTKVDRIRGCYNAGHNVGLIGDCDKQDAILSGPNQKQENSTVKQGGKSDSTNATSGKDLLDKLAIDSKPRATAMDPLDTFPDASKTNKDSAKALDIDPGDSSIGGNQSQSVSDSLSVYGTFDSGTKASSDTGVTLGKVFATGVAAQHLTEGISLRERRNAKGAYIEKKTACVKAVKDALGEKTTAADLSRCD